MKRRAFIGLGAASIGIGALHHTDAFSSAAANRGVSINAIDVDEGALLGIRNLDDENSDPVFENNTPHNMKVELSDSAFDPDVFGIANSDEKEISITNDGDLEDVTITATLFDGGTANQLFEDGEKKGTITLTRDFSVSPVFGIDGEINASESRGENKIVFNVNTTGNNEATIEGFFVEPKVENVSFEEDGSKFDGDDIDELPVSFNSEIEIVITRFRGPGGGDGNRPSEITIENEEFVDPSEADVVITLELAERRNVEIGIQATFE